MKMIGGVFGLLVLVVGASFGISTARQGDWAANAAPSTNVSGLITTDTVWDLAGSPYIVVGDVTVEPDVTLIIAPGVQVRFAGVYALTVRGTLTAEGTADQPILFTSNQSSPAPGDWGVIDLRSDSIYNAMRYVTLEYGGDSNRSGAGCVAGMVCASTSSLMIDHSLFQHSETRGLVLAQSSAEITNSTFTDHPSEAIRLHACDLNVGECYPTIMANTFTDNLYPILHIAPLNPKLGGNSASGNQINGYVFYVTCNVQGDNTWYANDLPYVVPAAGAWCNMGNWSRPTTVTIQPGTVIKLANAIQFYYTTAVTATGTVEAPIIFTSLKDDSVGGDTNNDGSASQPAREDWGKIDHSGSNAKGAYQHVIFRYGGGTAFGWGPLASAANGAQLTIRSSELYEAEVGVDAYNLGSLVFTDNSAHDLANTGVYFNSLGEGLIQGNRFENNAGSGMIVDKGTPLIRENLFQGNPTGVLVRNNTEVNPLVSPNNRFLGSGQTGIQVSWPQQVCVDAYNNWWGDVAGPSDASATVDACGLGSNTSSGAPVSDGVNYSPWIGGLSRPAIVSPRCGLNPLSQPELSGLSSAGSTVQVYDGDTLLGESLADSQGIFTFTPSAPLADGMHAFSAVAELDGSTSLPSKALSYYLDSSLPFDPAGLKLSYDFHYQIHTMHLLNDGFGCTSILSSPDLPLWVRPGSWMTVTVPIASQATLASFFPPAPIENSLTTPASMLASYASASPEAPAEMDFYVQNYSTYRITDVTYAVHRNDGVFEDHRSANVLDIDNYDTGVIKVPEDTRIVVNYWSGNRLVASYEVDTGDKIGELVAGADAYRNLDLTNETGRRWTGMYITRPNFTNQQIGGSYLSPENPIDLDENRTIELPWFDTWSTYSTVVIRDDQGVFYIRQIEYEPESDMKRTFTVGDPGEVAPTLFTNNLGKDICQLRLVRHPETDNGEHLEKVIGMPVNMLELLNTTIPKETSFQLKLEPGRYFVHAETCDHSVKIFQAWVLVGGVVSITECEGSGWVKANEVRSPFACDYLQLNSSGSTATDFQTCQAQVPFSEGSLGVTICRKDEATGEQYFYEVAAGEVLIDPDGVVYNANIGLADPIEDATVTCGVYDEDYQTWERWPAELYESQINPQVTADDGYYAFFVPPGLYRVWATASGYLDHTSSVIEVIDQIVHYNIPLVPTDVETWLFLPLLRR